MGRPIKKKFFANTNSPYDNAQTGGTSGVGGETVNAILVSNSGTAYSAGAVVTIGAPNIAGGVQATISYSRNSAGNLTVSLVNGGSGYTSAPAVAVTTASSVAKAASTGTAGATIIYVTNTNGIQVGMAVSGANVGTGSVVSSVGTGLVNVSATNADTIAATVTFTDGGASFAATAPTTTSTFQNGIAFTSFLLAKDNGANAVAGGDILKQESSRRYLVKNSEGVGQVKLIASDSVTVGTMSIIATDGAGSTYFVRKLTAKKAYLVNRTSTSTAVVTGLVAQWTVTGSQGNTLITAATGTNQVSIANN
jgi:hypothetical protein